MTIWICEYGNKYEGPYETKYCSSEELALKYKEGYDQTINGSSFSIQYYCSVFEVEVE